MSRRRLWKQPSTGLWSLSSSLADPPDPAELDPLTDVWPAGQPLVRCHHVGFGATEFNPGRGDGRFHPLRVRRSLVPTIYAAGDIDGALSETVFHNVPVAGPGKAVHRLKLKPMVVSMVACDRDLVVVRLHGHGLRRIGVTREQLISSDADQYEATRKWGAALYQAAVNTDGLTWVSRQHDTSRALVLFGSRVERKRFEVVQPPLPLFLGSGFDEVQRAAWEADITVIE